MTEQDSTASEGEQPKDEPKDTPKAEDKAQDAPKTFDAEYVAELRSEAAKRRVENQQLTERLEELEERDKSELEKAQGKLTKAEQRAATAEAALLRFEVARDKEIPAEAVDLLSGTTREDLEASADKILSLVKSRNGNDPKPDFDGGAREPASDRTPEEQVNDLALRVLTGDNR